MLSHLLDLSLVSLDPKRKKKILKDLEKILDYFSQIKNLKLEEEAKLIGNSDNQSLREDFSRTDLKLVKKLLKLSPKREKEYFKTKPIF